MISFHRLQTLQSQCNSSFFFFPIHLPNCSVSLSFSLSPWELVLLDDKTNLTSLIVSHFWWSSINQKKKKRWDLWSRPYWLFSYSSDVELDLRPASFSLYIFAPSLLRFGVVGRVLITMTIEFSLTIILCNYWELPLPIYVISDERRTLETLLKIVYITCVSRYSPKKMGNKTW